MLSPPWASGQCITLTCFHILQWDQVMDTFKLFTQRLYSYKIFDSLQTEIFTGTWRQHPKGEQLKW